MNFQASMIPRAISWSNWHHLSLPLLALRDLKQYMNQSQEHEISAGLQTTLLQDNLGRADYQESPTRNDYESKPWSWAPNAKSVREPTKLSKAAKIF